mgnify:CR=1 FL=1
MGKGSAPRPFSVANEEYASRWDAIFGKDKNKEQKKEEPKKEPKKEINKVKKLLIVESDEED